MNTLKGQPVTTASPVIMPMETHEQLSELFGKHHRRVLLAAYRITGSMADAEDVAQSVFLRLAGGGTAGMKNTGSYLYRAALNGALDLLRRRSAGEQVIRWNRRLRLRPQAQAHGRKQRLRAANWRSGFDGQSAS